MRRATAVATFPALITSRTCPVWLVSACGGGSEVLAQRGGVPPIAVLAPAMVAATMPTLVLFSTHYADYYSYGVLLVPLSLGL